MGSRKARAFRQLPVVTRAVEDMKTRTQMIKLRQPQMGVLVDVARQNKISVADLDVLQIVAMLPRSSYSIRPSSAKRLAKKGMLVESWDGKENVYELTELGNRIVGSVRLLLEK